MMLKNNEEIINEVSDSYKNELTSSSGKIVEKVSENNGDIIKNGLSESNIVKIHSGSNYFDWNHKINDNWWKCNDSNLNNLILI